MSSKHEIWFVTKYSFPYIGAPFLYNVPKMLSKERHKITIFSKTYNKKKFHDVTTKPLTDFLKELRNYSRKTKGKLDIIVYNHLVLVLLFTTPVLILKQKASFIRISFICESKWFSKIGSIISPFIVGLINKYYFKIFVFDQLLKDYLVSKGFNEGKIVIISTGINPEYFNPEYTNNNVKENQMIYIGSLHRRRKLEILIDSLEKVIPSYKDAKLVIIGEGPDKPRLEKLVKLRGLEENIIFLEGMEQSNIGKYIKESSICLAPYPRQNYDIQLPYKILEYAACAKPIITTRTTATMYYLGDSVVMTDLNKTDLANSIILLLRNSEARRKLSTSVVEIANRFSWERVIHMIQRELC